MFPILLTLLADAFFAYLAEEGVKYAGHTFWALEIVPESSPADSFNEHINWLFALLQTGKVKVPSGKSPVQLVDDVLENFHSQLASQIDSASHIDYRSRSGSLLNPTQRGVFADTAQALEQFFDHLHQFSNDLHYPRLCAKCAWEIAKYYQRAWDHYEERWQAKSIYWLRKTLEYDEEYAQSKFKSLVPPRSIEVPLMLKNEPNLLQRLQDIRTVSTVDDRSERTPPPYHGKSVMPIYDSGYSFSHAYHRSAAKHFESIADWENAVMAWETAVWLVARRSYRKELIKALKNASIKRKEYSERTADEQRKLDEDDGS